MQLRERRKKKDKLYDNEKTKEEET